MIEPERAKLSPEYFLDYTQGFLMANPDLLFDKVLDAKHFFIDSAARVEWLKSGYIPWLLKQWSAIDERISHCWFQSVGTIRERSIGYQSNSILREQEPRFGDPHTVVRLAYTPYPSLTTNDRLHMDFRATVNGRELQSVTANLRTEAILPNMSKRPETVRNLNVDVRRPALTLLDPRGSGLKLPA